MAYSLLTERQASELNKAVVQYLLPILLKDQDQNQNHAQLTNRLQQLNISQETNQDDNKENFQAKEDKSQISIETISQKLLGIPISQFKSDINDNAGIPSNYLEKKWTTVLRLQKKIFDLEKEVEDQKATIESLEMSLKKKSRGPQLDDLDEDGTVNKLNWVPNRLKSVLKIHRAPVNAVAIHPTKPILATGSSDGQIVIWNLLDLSEPERIIKNAHTKSVNSLSFQCQEVQLDNLDPNSPKKVLLASGSSDLLIKIWDVDSLLDTTNRSNGVTPIRVLIGHDHIVSSVKFSPTSPNQLLSCSRDKSIKVWDILSGWCTKSFVGHSDWVRSLDINKNGKYVLSCSNDQSVRLSYIESGVGIGLLIGHQQVVETAAFLPREVNEFMDVIAAKKLGLSVETSFLNNPIYDQLGYKYCCSGGRDDLINFWLLPTPLFLKNSSNSPVPSTNPRGVLIMSMRGHKSWIRNLQAHPNGTMLMSCSDDKSLKLWDLGTLENETGQFECIANLKSHEGFINTFQFAPPVIQSTEMESDDATDEKIEDKIKRELKAINKGMRCYLVSGSSDTTVRIWH